MLKHFQEPGKGGPGTIWSPEMLRKLVELIDSHKDPDRTIKDLTRIYLEWLEMLKDIPEDKCNNLEVKQFKRKFEKWPMLSGTWHDFLKYGKDAQVNWAKLPPGTLPDEELKAWRAKRQGQNRKTRPLSNDAGSLEDEASAVPPSKIRRLTLERANTDLDQLRQTLQTWARNSVLSNIPPAQAVHDTMERLREQIKRTVNDCLDESGANPNQPIVDLQIPRSSSWQQLLEMLIGSDAPSFEPGLSRLAIMQSRRPLYLDTFLRAAIGAAVTKWTLQPRPQGHQKAGDRYVMEVLRQISEVGADFVRQDAIRRELDKEIVPKVSEKAGFMAKELTDLLAVFMAPPRAADVDDYTSFTLIERRMSTGSEPSPGILAMPQWAVDWRLELQQIFEIALHLRVMMEKEGGEYEFSFPHPGDAGTDCTAVVGMLPTIKARFQPIRGGPFGALETLSVGQAYTVPAQDQQQQSMPPQVSLVESGDIEVSREQHNRPEINDSATEDHGEDLSDNDGEDDNDDSPRKIDADEEQDWTGD
ncbi:uncharacterized protein HMPREF1541_06945 [Cyphellophora europaea CBS 101466]|uniref:Uncharacterized protein n=1 Tax=Cyphellophora europaea (strain CBS 101466) TaxID=1220924 RepID=W2RT48_CYPE1|nr:uncharacterized protein HMPREF1541_06945 [Cyphellophora europaea CBS 101466]ETN38903.1 hypothetical protein HMPREF1541_06945 [Cyphellophora europaea CBS 101466]